MVRPLIAATILTFTLFAIVILPSEAQGQGRGNDLQVGFYASGCPKVEDIVAEVVARVHEQDPKLPPALLRLFFHDCFVKGCDASILLDATSSGEPIEKASTANGETLRGLEVVDEIKAQVEQECPKTVSCADILAFAAREAVYLAGLPGHNVPAGRRDSRTSRASDVDVNLPTPGTPLEDIINMFARRGLTKEDMVVLSGAHSIGKAQCTQFTDRLYKFTPAVPRDPSLNPTYADELAGKCPAEQPPGQALRFTVEFDPTTPLILDNQHYLNLQKGRGLLQSDQLMATDPGTRPIVDQMAASNEAWGRRFIKAMIKMGRINVLTKDEGVIRTNCRAYL
ncbi:putative peroxidase [Rosa chinensis]|uniref:Peroxidase n=1 Tax=Rosa chinensis TaxID=74649 RepID=A0A2P6R195_ROSCH|nr:peroxidase 57 [Rosa chinensis]PRQ40186.1 putative peroxidase [Rosa chinensis]